MTSIVSLLRMQLPPLYTLAAATGIAGSAWASGAIAGLSLMSIPAALSAPSASATVWATLFHRGFAIMPKVAGTTAISYLFAAFGARRLGLSWKGLVAGAVLTVAIVPYTVAFMGATNELLTQAAQGAHDIPQEMVSEFLQKWASLNLGRSLFPLAGTVAGLWTLFGDI